MSREQVIEHATDIARADGIAGLTIRGLAADLGVSPMALYRHVRDKDDLVGQVVDRMLSRAWRPRVARGDWRRWIVEAADRLRRFLVEDAGALDVYLRHPVAEPVAMARMQAMLEVLESGGLSPDRAWRAYGAIHTYTLGFAALEAARDRAAQDGAPASETHRKLAAFTSVDQFRDGVGYLLDGISTTD